MKLSACLIVKDEEKYLPFCLKSLRRLADEIIVVDTGSSDQTKEIAREHQARVFQTKWRQDFSRARNYALARARGDWILVIDADEFVPESSVAEIRKLIDSDQYPAYYLPLYSLLFSDREKALINIHQVPVTQIYRHVRLFKNHRGFQFRSPLHETVANSILEQNEKIGLADCPLGHYGFTIDRPQRNSRNLQAISRRLPDRKKDYTFYYNYGKTLCSCGQFSAGIFMLEKSLEESLVSFASNEQITGIDIHLILKEIGDSYLAVNNYDLALAAYAQAHQYSAEDPWARHESLFNVVQVLIRKNQFLPAKRILDFIINNFRQDTEQKPAAAFRYDPDILIKSQRIKTSLDKEPAPNQESAEAASPETSGSLWELADSWKKYPSQKEAAIFILEEAIRKKYLENILIMVGMPVSVSTGVSALYEMHVRLAEVLLASRQYRPAMAAAARAIKARNQKWQIDPLLIIGHCQLKMKNLPAARQAFETIEKIFDLWLASGPLDPGINKDIFLTALKELAEIHSRSGQTEKAQEKTRRLQELK